MASIRSSTSLLVAISLCATLIISPSLSQTCKNPKFTNNKLFANCTVLPTLESYLHWTYDASNLSLSIAFSASPSKDDGWVSWGINPTAKGMIGAQALLAYKETGSSYIVKTYNISNFEPSPSKISYDVWDISTESQKGTVTIFASIKVPAKMELLNHVWQVGPAVNKTSGIPAKHDMKKDNLNAKGTLALAADSTNSTISPSGSPSSSSNTTDGKNGAVSVIRNANLVLCMVLLALVIAALVSF